MNAIHPPASLEMAAAWDGFEADPDLWVGIVTGEGERAFSAGNDLKYQAAGGEFTAPPSGFGGLTSRLACNKPIIAAVNGIALGGGFEIALAADIIVASENARFGLPEPRVGLAALAGGMHRLPRQIGLKNAMALLLTGRHFDAREAYRFGLAARGGAGGRALAEDDRARRRDRGLRTALGARDERSRARRPRSALSRKRSRCSSKASARCSTPRTSSKARARSSRSESRTGKAADRSRPPGALAEDS